MRIVGPFAMAAVVILAAAPAWSQTTSGRLTGRVIDEGGAALPGATVTVASPALIGGERARVSDSHGEFAFVAIAPGEYTVKAELSGFATQERRAVKVRLGGATPLTITMPRARFEGEITVSDETPVVDPVQVNMEQVFDRKYLDRAAIGSAGRSYTAVLFQAAGADEGGSSVDPSVFGSTIGENVYYIDGADTTDPVSSGRGLRFNFDAVQEIQLQTAGYEAEYGRAIGGVVNLVTRSGGNNFSGTADLRYRNDSFFESGDHFDSGELENEYSALGFTLGGPVVRDRLWFFAAYEYRRKKDTPEGSPTTRRVTTHYPLGKLTWQVVDGWRLVGKYSGDPGEGENNNASPFVAPEATNFYEEDGRQASVELTAVLSDSLLWSAAAGTQRKTVAWRPQDSDISTPGHYNRTTGESYINYWSQGHNERGRDELATDLSWFVDDVAGAHEIKAGVELARLVTNDKVDCDHNREGLGCETGVVVEFYDDVAILSDRDPLFWWVGEVAPPVDFEGALVSGFVQDAWRPAPGLTLKLGVRYDTVDWDDDRGTTAATLSKLQPRLGVAWDLTGDARNVVRGSWGRFMHPANFTVPNFLQTVRSSSSRYGSCSVLWGIILGYPTTTADECRAFAEEYGLEYRTDPDGWDPAGWIYWDTIAPYPTEVDPGIRATYADEWLISYERALWDRSSIEVSYLRKKSREILEDTCRGNFYDGPSEDADCGAFLIFNRPERDYEGAVLRFETRTLDWLTLLASYTYSHSRGSADTRNYFQVDWDRYPEHWVNMYGYLNNQRRHRIKLNGFVLLPADFTVVVDAYWFDDYRYTPWADQLDDPSIRFGVRFEEPRGNREANDNSQIDLQISKGLTVGAVRLELIASVYNLLSSERPTGVCEHISGCGNPEGEGLVPLGAPTSWQEPRSWELGFRLEF